jgi:hypothetical protein
MAAVAIATAATTVPGFATAQAVAAELVIYSSRHYGQEAACEAFSKKTGIQLKILTAALVSCATPPLASRPPLRILADRGHALPCLSRRAR